jgi:hypothetical protein
MLAVESALRAGAETCLVVGVDSLLDRKLLFELRPRLLDRHTGDGILPGEAAAAFVVERGRPGDFQVLGVGSAMEACVRGGPCRADGLVEATKGMLQHASGCGWNRRKSVGRRSWRARFAVQHDL